MAATPTLPDLSPYHWLDDEPDESAAGVHVHKIAATLEVPIQFTHDVFSWENLAFVRAVTRRDPHARTRLSFVIDRAVSAASPWLVHDVERYVLFHGERLELLAPPIVIDGGERAKTDPAILSELRTAFETTAYRDADATSLGRGRNAVVIVGGGAVQDVAGYAAATSGLAIVRVPTTVLSQGEASVSLRSFVNAFGRKDAVATFAPPLAVIDDFEFLRTLPRRDAVAGLAAGVEAAVLGDAELFAWMVAHRAALAACDPTTLAQLVRRTALPRAFDRAVDPHDDGDHPLARWSARRLEVLTGFELRHGEALAIALAIDAACSAMSNLVPEGVAHEIVEAIEALGLPVAHEILDARDAAGRPHLLGATGALRDELGTRGVSLVAGIGCAASGVRVDELLVARAIEWLRGRRA